MRVGALLRAATAGTCALLVLIGGAATADAVRSGDVFGAAVNATAALAGVLLLLAGWRLTPGGTR